MPLGDYPSGVGPLGHDPVADPSAAASPQPLAPLIHPGSKDAVALAGGALQGVHPVDQAVSLALGIRRGTLGSLPGQGSGLLDLTHRGRGFEAQVRFVVEAALATLINRRDIALIETRVETAGETSALVVTYRNLRLRPDPSDPAAAITLRVPVT